MVLVENSKVHHVYAKCIIPRCKVRSECVLYIGELSLVHGVIETYQGSPYIVEVHHSKLHSAYCMVEVHHMMVHCA